MQKIVKKSRVIHPIVVLQCTVVVLSLAMHIRSVNTGYAVEGRSEHCPAHVTNEASFSSASSLTRTHSNSSNDSSTAPPSPDSSGSVSSSPRSSTRSSGSTSSGSSSCRSSESEAMKKDATPPPRPVVLIANHQSMLDVAAIFALELKIAWVAKTAVFMMPGVGWLMYMAGYVPVSILFV